MDKTVDDYLDLPYTIELIPEPAGGWFVGVRELPGCISAGDTPAQAIEMIRDAMRGWIEISLEDGDPIPEPRDLDAYSGKFVVRVPRSLHRDLVDQAEREGVSLNQFVGVALARAVGQARGPAPTVRPVVSGLGPVPGVVPGAPRAQAAMVIQEAGAPYSAQEGGDAMDRPNPRRPEGSPSAGQD